MNVVMLFNRTNLPYGVKTRPRCIRTNRLPKPPLELLLLLLPEHHLASGGTLELEHKFGFLSLKLLLDLGCHPIEASGDLLLIPGVEKIAGDTRQEDWVDRVAWLRKA